MMRGIRLTCLCVIACVSGALPVLTLRAAAPAALTLDQIIQRNIAARGGLQAWHQIQTMTLTGKMDAGSKNNVQIPFVMKLKRPQMSRLEIEFAGKTALQIYDGKNGWKVRPFMGRNEVEPFTDAELKNAGEGQDLDGPLIDHDAKGIKVELAGIDTVEGHDAYKLRLTMKNGNTHHLWVDAQSFLELKVEGFPRTLDGKSHTVEVYYRNFGPVGSVKVPYLLETVVEGVKPSHKMIIDTYALNSSFEDRAFAKPDLPGGIVPASPLRSAPPVQTGNVINQRGAK